MTVHFDNTRWDAIEAGLEAMDAGTATCRDCGLHVSVVNDTVRVKDGTVYPQPGGGFYVVCSACEKVTSR